MLFGPRVRANMVSRYPFDPSSIHQLIAWRFGLDPLGVRAIDPNTFNMAYALDFIDAARTDSPAIGVTQGTFGVACSTAGIIPGLGGVDHSQRIPPISASGTVANPRGGRFADLRAKATSLGFPGGM
jgi:phospholipase C